MSKIVNTLSIARRQLFTLMGLMLLTPSLANATTLPDTATEIMPSSRSEKSFDRLFTTREQRQVLDKKRNDGGFSHPQIVETDENIARPVAKPVQPIKFSGMLLRADGHNQVWVNGKSDSPESERFLNKLRTQGSAKAKIPLTGDSLKMGNGSMTSLKPGQVLLPNSGGVKEAYQLPSPKSQSELALTSSSLASSSQSTANTSSSDSQVNTSSSSLSSSQVNINATGIK